MTDLNGYDARPDCKTSQTAADLTPPLPAANSAPGCAVNSLKHVERK